MRDILIDLEEGQDPQRQAQKHMKPKMPKRFYKDVTVAKTETGYAVLLDGRAIKTPSMSVLHLTSEAAAQLIAKEFDAQAAEINALTMPTTRIANSAAEGVIGKMAEVRADLVSFAGSDLVCYRAETPVGLFNNQNTYWNPIIDWAEHSFGKRPALAGGIIHVTQPEHLLTSIEQHLDTIDNPYRLAALHVMTTLTGSVLLPLCHIAGAITLEAAWQAAHVDEDWNIEMWGPDADAEKRRDLRLKDMKAASNLFQAA